MTSPTRRTFLLQTAGAAGGIAALSILGPTAAFAQEAGAEDLVETGDAFRRGTVRGAVADAAGLRASVNGGTYTSAPLRSVGSFTHVGLHWQAELPPRAGLSFELRTSADGVNWSAWTPVHVEREADETPAGDAFGALVYAGDARLVQYRAIFRTAGGASPTLRRVTATAIDSPATTATSNQHLTVPVTDGVRSLSVTSREQWNADEKLRFKGTKELWPEMFVPSKKLIVHHTATRNDYVDGAAAAAEVRAIYRYHAVTQRWGDIGYQALVDKFGNIYEGRHGRGEGTGREVLSAGVVAGHNLSHNYGSSGVALLGDATAAGWAMPSPSGSMWDALVRYSVFESGRNGLRPEGMSDFLRSNDTWTDSMNNVSGHQETNATACPGKVMDLLPTLRGAIRDGLAPGSRTGVTLTAPPSRELALGKTVSYSWSAEPPEGDRTVVGYETCFEGWFKPARSYDISYYSGYDGAPQPSQVWTPVGKVNSGSFKPAKAGHYTLHVRAILSDGTRAAYEANHTLLVK